MIDRLRQIAIFAKAVDHGSFRAAARELKLSPSVVSHHVSQLEEHLGVALMVRSTRKLRLTQEGEKLLSAARIMLETVETELSTLSIAAKQPSGELRITLPSVLSQSHLVDLIANFTARYPRITLFLDFSDLRKDLIDDDFDVAIRMGMNKKGSATAKKLFSVTRRIFASPSYLKKHDAVIHPSQLDDMDWIELSQLQGKNLTLENNMLNQQVDAVTIKKSPGVYCNDAQALYRLARAGVGLAAVPEFLALDDLKNRQIEIVLPQWKLRAIDIIATWPANAPKTGLIKLFINHLLGH